MMGLNDRLRLEYPSLQSAVEDGVAIQPPDGLHLLLAFTTHLQLRVSGGGGVRQENLPDGRVRRTFAYAEIARAPLYLVLTDYSDKEYWLSALPITPWLAEPPGRNREVYLLLPLVQRNEMHAATVHTGLSLRSVARRASWWCGPA